MDIKKSRWPGSDYKLNLNWMDRQTLRDLREETFFLIGPEEGGWPSRGLAAKLGKIASKYGIRSVRLKEAQLLELAGQFQAFSRRTDSMIDEIHNLGLAFPRSQEVAQARYDRGEYAGRLALRIDGHLAVNSTLEEIDAEVRELLDGHLSDKG